MTQTAPVFALVDLLAWLQEKDAARPALGSDRSGAFSTVTMSSLPDGSPPMAPGGLFIAIRGATRDGHDFVANAFENGASAALVKRVPAALTGAVETGTVQTLDFRSGSGGVPAAPRPPEVDSRRFAAAGAGLDPAAPALVLVDEPLAALQGCAAWWRRQQRARILAVTGSVGKTTTKELLANILERRGVVLRTHGNLNNELGLPITLLQLAPTHDFAVLEIGINAVGEMATFAGIARPEIGVVTRVAATHLEGLRDLDTIEREKGMLVECLPAGPEGVAVLNHDDPRVARMAARTRARVVPYGVGPEAAVRAAGLTARGFEGIAFDLLFDGTTCPVFVPLIGQHFVSAALAAAAAALAAGAEAGHVVAGLAQPSHGRRLEPRHLPNGATVLDDTYNASPEAMKAALDVLAGCAGRRLAVLGDMFEMGAAAAAVHREVGAYVPGRADVLVCVGPLSREIASAALEGGFPAAELHWCKTPAEAIEYLQARLRASDFVLVKGSRGMRLEQIVSALTGRESRQH